MDIGREIITQLDGWVKELAAPLLPPRVIQEGGDDARLEFKYHEPHSVMIGKLVRAVSGVNAALLLADAGFVAECGTLLRVVSDFCTEILAVAEALHRGGALPNKISDFVDQYFNRKPKSVIEFCSSELPRYVSRKEIMKGVTRLCEGSSINIDEQRHVHQYLNMFYDAYVHGSYETTMDLYEPLEGNFAMKGYPNSIKRKDYVDSVFLKMHEVVAAIEVTAALTGDKKVFEESREVRRLMDESDPWRTLQTVDKTV
jgi:hypothetical protein